MSDQETGPPPPDPNDPAQSSETAVPAPDPENQPKSPDEDPGDEAREGGTPTHAKGEEPDEDEDDEE